MTRKILFASISLFILLSTVLAEDANSFYVEQGTIEKTDRVWKFKLLNHHGPSPIDSRNPELMHASVTVESLDKDVLHLKIVNASGTRWEAPLYNPAPGKNYEPGLMDNMGFTFTMDPFTFEITTDGGKTKLLSTKTELGGTFKFFDKFIEVGYWYPTKKIIGYGQRSTPDLELCHARTKCIYSTFNADALNPLDNGEPPGGNQTYGTHTFYMVKSGQRSFMGTFLLNVNSQEIEINKHPAGDVNLYHRTIGGVIDFYFFYLNSADTLIKKYHDLIGRPYLPPFWTLGYHQCRWGWNTIEKVKDVVAKFEQYDIPLETVWGDIDYMKDFADFTIDPVRFKGLKEFVESLHKRKMRWVPILDGGLKYDKDNKDKYITEGEKHGALVKSAFHAGETFVGFVWPGPAAYVDFSSPYGSALWQMGLKDFEDQVNYDGIWVDMNEASNFCNGECVKENGTYKGGPHDPTEFDNLPYIPGGRHPNTKAIDMAAYHYSTTPDGERLYNEFNMHSIWSTEQSKATYEYLNKRNRRPYLMTRSSFAGAGMYTSIWGGDNYSTWEYMRYSIISVITFQMFGMPLSGADMCGFVGNVTEELCARWMQMGSFYPFTRNHNEHDANDQEPYVFGERVATASRNAIRQKYSLLHYYYTKLYEVSLFGGSMYSPVYFSYPEDENAYLDRNDTFMIGESLLIAPVLYQGATEVTPYCPNDNWYDLRTHMMVAKHQSGENGTRILMKGGYDFVNVLVRGGSIIPFQDAVSAKVRRTETLRMLPMQILVAPDHKGYATGTMIVDDGESLNPIEKKAYRYYKFAFDREGTSTGRPKLTVKLLNNYENDFDFEKFWRVVIFDAESMKAMKKACLMGSKGYLGQAVGVHNSEKKTMTYNLASSDIYWSDIDYIDFDEQCTYMTEQ